MIAKYQLQNLIPPEVTFSFKSFFYIIQESFFCYGKIRSTNFLTKNIQMIKTW